MNYTSRQGGVAKMITREDLSSVIDNNVLQDLFVQRNETISNMSAKDKKNLKGLYLKQDQTKEELETSLNNLPNCFEKCKKQVIKCVDNHIESSSC
jgi:hypothetical protein